MPAADGSRQRRMGPATPASLLKACSGVKRERERALRSWPTAATDGRRPFFAPPPRREPALPAAPLKNCSLEVLLGWVAYGNRHGSRSSFRWSIFGEILRRRGVILFISLWPKKYSSHRRGLFLLLRLSSLKSTSFSWTRVLIFTQRRISFFILCFRWK